MRRSALSVRLLLLVPGLLAACNGFPSTGVRGPSPEPPAADQPRHQVTDRNGNDSWDAAGQMTVDAAELLTISGQLGAVDADGVLDQVDYFRFQARHRSLLLLIDGKVEVELVTASDQPVTPVASAPRWYDPLSLAGGYALRVRPRLGQVETYALTLIAGAGVGADCSEVCRWGLWCIEERCAQDGQPGEACVDAGDCHLGWCVDGVCSAEDDACAADVARCRAGQMQVCTTGSWTAAGRCDTGCWDDQCAPFPASSDGEGATCDSDVGCSAGFLCVQTDADAETGICLAICYDSCPGGEQCVSLGTGQGVCLPG